MDPMSGQLFSLRGFSGTRLGLLAHIHRIVSPRTTSQWQWLNTSSHSTPTRASSSVSRPTLTYPGLDHSSRRVDQNDRPIQHVPLLIDKWLPSDKTRTSGPSFVIALGQIKDSDVVTALGNRNVWLFEALKATERRMAMALKLEDEYRTGW